MVLIYFSAAFCLWFVFAFLNTTNTTSTLRLDQQYIDHSMDSSRASSVELNRSITTLLEKYQIRASSSPGGAADLFIKKPGLVCDFAWIIALQIQFKDETGTCLDISRSSINGRTLDKLSQAKVRAMSHRLRKPPGDEWKAAFRTR